MISDSLKARLEAFFFADTEKFWFRLQRHQFHRLLDELGDWELLQNRPETESEDDWLLLQSIAFLRHKITTINDQLARLEVNHNHFLQRVQSTEFSKEKQLHILDYAKQLGASSRELEQDSKAFARWFDEAAMSARYQDKVSRQMQLLKFLMTKLGTLSNRYLKSNQHSLAAAFTRLDIEPFFVTLLGQSQNQFIQHSLVRALVNMIATVHDLGAEHELSADLIAQLIELLESEQLHYLAIADVLEILIHQRPTYIRAHMWAMAQSDDATADYQAVNADALYLLSVMPKILVDQVKLNDKDFSLLQVLAEHNLPRVRQATLEYMAFYPTDFATKLLQQRFAAELDNAVRFTLLKQITAPRFVQHDVAFTLWSNTLQGNYHPQIKRLALELSAKVMLNMQTDSCAPEECFQRFIALLNACLETEQVTSVCRHITRAREQLASFYQQHIVSELYAGLESRSEFTLSSDVSRDNLGRALSYLAQHNQSMNAERHRGGWRVIQHYKLARRFWRLCHELRTPATDKRQGFSHSKAKKPSLDVHVPSCTTAEISATRLPGELQYLQSEQSSRGHLPLLDFLLSVLTHDHRTEVAKTYTPDGILAVAPPPSLLRRLKAYWLISWQYAELDELRKGNQTEQQKYLHTLRDMGFDIQLLPYGNIGKAQFPLTPDLKTLFNGAAIMPFLSTLWGNFKEYFSAVYQNTLSQLVFFVVSFISYFWARHAYVSRKIRRDREHIPVSIGGWGTRGKSGTERLKSALFSSLALRVISKTTGCEAMLIYSKVSGEQYEVPLFRPFDKASIWEQADVLAFAKSVKADVFLWECMGLTPRYVKILVRWMKDNFATITNAYPDHEDILGPSGYDVAQEMTAFIGQNTQVFTAEQNMAPVLNLAARQKNTSLIQTHWGEGFQITPDVLAKYSYFEHPDNIALVAKMAQYIGISKDYVYKETAARVLPDVGVLQQFPTAQVAGVQQTFINSMSANERLATLENWRRLNIVEQGQDGRIIALINNRNDRIARSQVFANILVHDLSFDDIVVIGSNVDGFEQYFQSALQQQLHRIMQNSDKQALTSLLQRFRMDSSATTMAALVTNTLPDIPADCHLDAVKLEQHLDLSHATHRSLLQRVKLWQLGQTLAQLAPAPQHSDQVETFASAITKLKCHVIHHFDISPDELTNDIANLALQQERQIIVGMQNIKGPGLGYVYMWQKWHLLNKHCERLFSRAISQTEFRASIHFILQQPHLSLLECQFLQEQIAALKALPIAQNEFCQAELEQIQQRVEQGLVAVERHEQTTTARPLMTFLLKVAESFLEAGEAVKRKKLATQIYQDIASFRISIERATTLLHALNKSQKAGWLSTKEKPGKSN